MRSYKYFRWDGTQSLQQVHHDELMEELSDHLLAQGDLQSALRTMMQKGMRNGPMMGLQDLLKRLRSKRQETLDKYQLNSLVDALKQQLESIVETEQEGIQRRLDETRQRLQDARRSDPQNSPGGSSQSNDAQDALNPDDAQRLGSFMEQLAREKMEFLQDLPKEVGGAVKALSEYDFMDSEAKRQFDELMEQLRQQMMDNVMDRTTQGLQNVDQQQAQSMKDMLHDLNELLNQQLKGGNPQQDYQQFKEKWEQSAGMQFPENFQELMENLQHQMQMMQNMMESMSGQQRQQFQDLTEELLDQIGLQDELEAFSSAMAQLFPDLGGKRYPFRGDDSLDMQEAMDVMGQLDQLEALEKELREAQFGDGVDKLDPEVLRKLLGDEEAQSLESLQDLGKELESAGYIKKDGQMLELTPRGMRKIGQKALRDIFDRLKQGRPGDHANDRRGAGVDLMDEVKRYEFGDPFFLDLERTVMNAVERRGQGVPVQLQPADFQVYRTEYQSQSATVLMLDLSWSMARRGSFYAAKKVILALHNLIRTQFPRDSVYIVGFSTYAREVKPDQLPYITWDQAEPYTNMQQGLIISQRLLSRHKSGTKQIIMISDGEPTAHVERGQIFLGYPPSPRTISETLREVKRCTQGGILINVFMLDRSYYLKEFVDQLTRINKGRAFYTTPEKLGQYVMVDYLAGKRHRVA